MYYTSLSLINNYIQTLFPNGFTICGEDGMMNTVVTSLQHPCSLHIYFVRLKFIDFHHHSPWLYILCKWEYC